MNESNFKIVLTSIGIYFCTPTTTNVEKWNVNVGGEFGFSALLSEPTFDGHFSIRTSWMNIDWDPKIESRWIPKT
jgi:hypothetical protein